MNAEFFLEPADTRRGCFKMGGYLGCFDASFDKRRKFGSIDANRASGRQVDTSADQYAFRIVNCTYVRPVGCRNSSRIITPKLLNERVQDCDFLLGKSHGSVFRVGLRGDLIRRRHNEQPLRADLASGDAKHALCFFVGAHNIEPKVANALFAQV